MAKIIIGLTGEMASGKSTVAKYLQEKRGAVVYRFSNILRDALSRIHQDNKRENLQIMSTMLRETYGEDVLARAMAGDAENDTNNVVVVDGVRRLGDIEHLKKLSGFKLIYMEAHIEKCHQRISVRGENVDDNGKTFEQFQEDRGREAEQQIVELKAFADIVIDNNANIYNLYQQINEFVKSE